MHGLARLRPAPGLVAGAGWRLAAPLDKMSQHVIALAVVSGARERGLTLSLPSDVEELPGAGISGSVDGRRVVVGSHSYVMRSASPTDWSRRFLRRVDYE